MPGTIFWISTTFWPRPTGRWKTWNWTACCKLPRCTRVTSLPARVEDDITNFTNRSPYPTLHLLREDSIDRAVAAFPDPESIFEVNMQTMERLGLDGWAALKVDRTDAARGIIAP